MSPASMSYGGYVWPRNPETVKVEREKITAVLEIPGSVSAVQPNGSAPRRVSGSGRFTGAGCTGEFSQLCAAFDAGGSAVLRLPGMEAFPAVFTSLLRKGGPKPDSVGYEFVFLEDASAAVLSEPRTYTCMGGETLWDVANRYGTDVDTLLAANPEIEWPNALEAGRVVTVP